MLHPDYPLRIIPVNFGVKFNPPKLGLEYTMVDQPLNPQTFEMALQPLLDRNLGADEIVNELFRVNKSYLHEKVIAKTQVLKLIKQILNGDPRKKNSQAKAAKAAAPSILTDNKEKRPGIDANWMLEQDNQSNFISEQEASVADDNHTENSVVINPSAMDDFEIQIKDTGNKDKFLAGVGMGQGHQSQEQLLNMGGASDEDNIQESDCAVSNNQFPQEHDEEPLDAIQGQDEMLGEEDEDADVIDIDNPEGLARRGLQRVFDETEEVEYLLDQEGNLFNLQGEFMGKMPDYDEAEFQEQ